LLARTETESPRRAESNLKPATVPTSKADSTPKAIPQKQVPQVAQKAPAYATDDMPPPPDNFPDGWDTEWQPSFDEVAIASKAEPTFEKDEPVAPPRALETVARIANPPHEELMTEETEQIDLPREALLPSLYVPLVKEDRDKEHPPQQITITLRSTGDHERDKRRIKTMYGTLISYHGRDKFSFQIFENSKGHLIDFPNDSTRICPELFERLKKLIGEESWRVEEITFQ
jgi:hypothetical protein